MDHLWEELPQQGVLAEEAPQFTERDPFYVRGLPEIKVRE
jgi:hypothetical protein